MVNYLLFSDIDDCVGQPCINRGVCVDGINSYTCNCVDGYDAKNCENSRCLYKEV